MTASNHRGFTLLELLVGLAIATLIIAAAYTTLFSLTRAQESASLEMDQRRALRTSLDLMRRELSSLLYRADDARLKFVVEDRDYFGKPASNLAFGAIAAPSLIPVSDQLILRYRSDTSKERLILTKMVRELFMEGDDPKAYPLMDGIEGFLVECYDGSRWLKTWDTALNKSLPKLVRITITVREAGKPVSYQAIAKPRMVAP